MELWHSCCAGLDVHKDSVEACVRQVEGGQLSQATRHWGTMTRELMAMAAWLREQGVSPVAMESTGVYGKPIFHVLEDEFEVRLVNARDLKHVPGRKTDVAGRSVDRATAATRAAEGEFHSSALAAGTAGSDAATIAVDRRTQSHREPDAEGAGRYEPEARFGGQRCARRIGKVNAAGDHRGRERSATTGRPGTRTTARQA